MVHTGTDSNPKSPSIQESPETPIEVRKVPVSASSFSEGVHNDEGTLHMETPYATFRLGINAVDTTDMLLSESNGSSEEIFKSISIHTDRSSGLHSGVLPKNHREGYPSLPLMMFEVRPKNILLPSDELSSKRTLLPPITYGALVRVNESPLFTVDRGNRVDEMYTPLDSAFTVMPPWGNGVTTGSILDAAGKPAHLGRQGFFAPELPAVLEVIFLASGADSEECIALAGCSVNLFRELEKQPENG